MKIEVVIDKRSEGPIDVDYVIFYTDHKDYAAYEIEGDLEVVPLKAPEPERPKLELVQGGKSE